MRPERTKESKSRAIRKAGTLGRAPSAFWIPKLGILVVLKLGIRVWGTVPGLSSDAAHAWGARNRGSEINPNLTLINLFNSKFFKKIPRN